MEDEEEAIRARSTQDDWVRVDPDQPVYQRLHLCLYLAELPELTTSESDGKDSEGGESPHK